MSKGGARILVVDDEVEIVRALQRSLTAHGFEVFAAYSGEEALEAVAHYRPDVMVLDLGLPGMSGLEVAREVRAQSNLPIIVLSVKDTERDKVQALDLGADDYVSKPFGVNEVLARIRVALRHSAQVESGTQPVFTAGPLSVDFAHRQVLLERERGQTDANGVRSAQGAHQEPGKNYDAPDAALPGMGNGLWRGIPLSPRLCRAVASQDRA